MQPTTQKVQPSELDFPAIYLAVYQVNNNVGYLWLKTFQGAISFLETVEAKGAKPMALVVDKIVWKAQDVSEELIQSIVRKLLENKKSITSGLLDEKSNDAGSHF